MVCLGFEPGAAGWKVQMNPLSYGGTPLFSSCYTANSVGWNEDPLASMTPKNHLGWSVDKK